MSSTISRLCLRRISRSSPPLAGRRYSTFLVCCRRDCAPAAGAPTTQCPTHASRYCAHYAPRRRKAPRLRNSRRTSRSATPWLAVTLGGLVRNFRRRWWEGVLGACACESRDALRRQEAPCLLLWWDDRSALSRDIKNHLRRRSSTGEWNRTTIWRRQPQASARRRPA
jgi:hypothetical protein